MKSPKVLLVNPYSKRFPWELKRGGHPVSLLTLGTYLIQVLGIDTEILDATAKNFINDTKLENGKIRFGLTPTEFKKEIVKYAPDIVLFSNQFTCQHSSMIECASLVKEVSNKILVGVGGLHVSALPEETLRNACIDYVFLGEENCLNDFFFALKGKKAFNEIKSFGYKQDVKIILNNEKCYVEQLEKSPIYNLELLDETLYENLLFHNGVSNEKFIDIVTERGCIYNCNFCATGNRGTPYRTHSIHQIDTLFSELKEKGYQLILNEDDIGFFNKSRIKQLIKLYNQYNFSWHQVHGIAPNQIDDELIDLMADSKCEKIYLALESSNPDFRFYVLNKPKAISSFNNREIVKTIKKLENRGIKVDIGLIIGHPSQTLEDIKTDIEFGKMLKDFGADFVMPWILTIFPGTPFWNKLKDFRVGNYDDCNVMTGNLANEVFNPQIMRNIQEEAIEYINSVSYKKKFLKFGWDSN